MKKLDSDRREILESILGQMRRDFEESGNPLFVFRALQCWDARRAETLMPLPEWILDYMRDSADRLFGWDPEKSNQGKRHEKDDPAPMAVPWDEPRQTVAKAMGFRGELPAARGQWRNYNGGSTSEALAFLMVHRMWFKGISLEAAAIEAEAVHLASRCSARRAVENASTLALNEMRILLRRIGVPPLDGPVWKTFSRCCADGGERPSELFKRGTRSMRDTAEGGMSSYLEWILPSLR